MYCTRRMRAAQVLGSDSDLTARVFRIAERMVSVTKPATPPIMRSIPAPCPRDPEERADRCLIGGGVGIHCRVWTRISGSRVSWKDGPSVCRCFYKRSTPVDDKRGILQ